jgi:predicted MPP superfamily phosphohydrolase
MSPLLLCCFLLLATLGHGYLWMDVVNRIHAWPGPRKIVDRVTHACFLAFLILPLGVLYAWPNLQPALESNAPFAILSLKAYLLLCAGWGAVKLVLSWVYQCTANDRRALLEWKQERVQPGVAMDQEDLQAGMTRWLAKVPGNQFLQLHVDHKRLALANLNPKLAGLKIAHLSDLHLTGRIGLKWHEHLTEQVNALEPDVIMITGDIVENEACWPWLASTLGKLSAPQGVYFILGNHDFYIDTTRTQQLLQQQGLISLSSRRLQAHWNGVPVWLAGNERPWNPQVTELPPPDPDDDNSDESNSDSAVLRLVLLHSPDEFAWASQQQADLALAGHTHGGQLRFPILGPIASPSRFGTKYACGVFRQGQTVMHVTRGISGKTPLRWNCPPEIALLELVQQQRS